MLEHLALSETGFLFDSRTGSTYSLSATGTLLLRALMEGTDADALGARLAAVYEIEPDAAARDAEQFVLRLRELGLVDREGERETGRGISATTDEAGRR